MRKHLGVWMLVLLLAVVVFILTGCGNQSAQPKTGKINVVSSLDFYGEVAKEVLGDHGKVTTLINNPSVDPHDFEPTTGDAKKVAQANVTIANGLGYDDWMQRLTSNGSETAKNVLVGEEVMHKHDGDNEHVWYNPQTMGKLATQLAATYSKIDPQHKQQYYANAHKYQRKLRKLNQLISRVKTKVSGQKADVSEPIFDYGLEALNVKINDRHFENAIDKGVDPTPADIKKIQTDIKDHRIAFFVDNKQVSSHTVTDLVELAQENNVPVLKVTETLPKGQTYLEWMTSQYQALEKLLK
ncbi:ABC transporter substrate-binding protein [Lentilactobacillus senioris DSM 24302 = JCM 17472]|uniref:ABC transporter substrate-binding protein n=1 Tax=Lentilactobacillus senioris DSM 24302 = JCM 17472 TaxID=1423802 RepID=A0A0R2CT42_9LACO|nr:zinc ABC transporter substrate-binding protein [Lentilactobacillus senioris]KRM94496.1 ABC transporter substrate-binding protein [Lentilactobacillus senioris DSM 24302 = JCM 17472]